MQIYADDVKVGIQPVAAETVYYFLRLYVDASLDIDGDWQTWMPSV